MLPSLAIRGEELNALSSSLVHHARLAAQTTPAVLARAALIKPRRGGLAGLILKMTVRREICTANCKPETVAALNRSCGRIGAYFDGGGVKHIGEVGCIDR